ncbi:MAG: hypothetical protein J6S67_21610 [Methanobrevibacter sp.]|nr:hypothetical protein [Methanobrevibacter sp.]
MNQEQLKGVIKYLETLLNQDCNISIINNKKYVEMKILKSDLEIAREILKTRKEFNIK